MRMKLNNTEMLWLGKLFSVDFKGKEILQNQLLKAEITVYEEFSFISLKFNIDVSIKRFPFNDIVPVEMRAFQENSAPIIFLLCVIDGFIDEIEVFTADSSEINTDLINLENIEYIIDEKVCSVT